MVDFLYFDSYQVESALEDESEPGCEPVGVQEITAHLRCHAIAEGYQIPAMSNYALERLRDILFSSHPSDVADTLKLIACIPTSNAVKCALRDAIMKRIRQMIKDEHFKETLETSTEPSITGLTFALLCGAVLEHEATIIASRELGSTIRHQGEQIQALEAEVAVRRTALRRCEEAHEQSERALTEQSARTERAEAALRSAEEARKEAEGSTARWLTRAESAETSLANAKVEARGLHAQAAQIQKLTAEKVAAVGAQQVHHAELQRTQQANESLTTQLQQSQEETRLARLTGVGNNRAINAKLLVMQRRCAEHEQTAEIRRRRLERHFHMMNKLHACYNCAEEFLAKLQKPPGAGTQAVIDVELSVRCKE